MSKRVSRRLPVPLTDSERKQMSAELARDIGRREELDNEKRAAAKDYSERLQHADVEIRNVAATLTRGTILRDVECEEQRSWSTREIWLVRQDTGEVVERRTMTADELQIEFPEDNRGSFQRGVREAEKPPT